MESKRRKHAFLAFAWVLVQATIAAATPSAAQAPAPEAILTASHSQVINIHPTECVVLEGTGIHPASTTPALLHCRPHEP